MAFFSARLQALIVAFFIGMLAPPLALAQSDELANANELVKLKEYDRALAQVEAYLKEHPKDARGRFMKGLILAEQKKTDDAIIVFTDLTRDFPELPEPYNNLAVLYANQGQYDKARSALEMAIRTHPSYATAHENLGDVYAKMASQAYGKALQLDRDNRTAQTKLNLIRELFSGTARSPQASASQSPQIKASASPESAKPKPAVEVASAPPPGKSTAAPSQTAVKEAATKEAQPATTVESVVSAGDDSQSVLKIVEDWAKAWSDNDIASYLAHYAPDFDPPGSMSRAAWEAQRKARIAKPRNIEVTIESPKVVFTGEKSATVTFRQQYHSDTLKASGTKILFLVKHGNTWLIKREQYRG